ncbi:MFS transporter [Pullulanibacillus camelliae]|uniref:MFS transporter n=1 Tax=Pullulanibacillus camelliae TaxID=1707096 RepID=A0A8J3E0M2_9BACL|nr:MFS transporter [Pullulanibacillus camelliae]GGE54962.1 MFS transporter [Pullulanibacillus camelliae]
MSILRNRNFAILFSGQIVSAIGNNLFMIALPWFVFSMTGSKSDLALTGIFQTLPSIVGLFIGVFIDRWRKRRTLIWTNILRATISLALYFVVLLHPPFMTLLILVLLLELVGTFYRPAEASLLPLILPQEKLSSTMGLVQSGGALAQLFGVLLGGTLIFLIGAPLLFLINTITFAFSLISLFFVRVKEVVPTPTKRSSFVREWLDGIRTIVRLRVLLRITLAAMVTNCALAPIDLVMTAWVKGPMNGNGLMLGIINASVFIGILIGGMLLGHMNKRIGLKTILFAGLVIADIGVSLIGIFIDFYWAIAFGLISGFALGTLNGSIGALALQVIPKEMRGRMFSTLGAVSTLAIPLGMAIYGWLLVYVPLQWMYVLIGLPAILSGLSFLLPLKDGLGQLRDKDNNQLEQKTVNTDV